MMLFVRLIAMVATSVTIAAAIPAAAQTHSARDTATAYGSRLTAKGVPANLNRSRVNSRINSRLDSRLALRIERYRTDSSNNPAAAFQATQSDKSRAAAALGSEQQQAAQQYEELAGAP